MMRKVLLPSVPTCIQHGRAMCKPKACGGIRTKTLPSLLPESLSEEQPTLDTHAVQSNISLHCCRQSGSFGVQILTAQVQEILTEGDGSSQKAIGVRLADGRVFRGRTVVSNATRWDTFEKLMGGEERLPPSEQAFRKRYKKSPSFLSIHMGVRADVLPAGTPLFYRFQQQAFLASGRLLFCMSATYWDR